MNWITIVPEASATGVSETAVKAYTVRAMSSLQTELRKAGSAFTSEEATGQPGP